MLVTLALYHRDGLSRGNSRRIFGYEAYHWGLLFVSGADAAAAPLYSFDATDASDIDPFLGQLIVGAVPDGDADAGSLEELRAFFEEVPLPVKNTHPQQSCVTWAVAALGHMQTRGWVRPFGLPSFQDAALAYADARIAEEATEPAIKEYYA
ncbi:hypothetical protein BBAD15_g9709 [Beauveria bassiana D1-5]|uniref:Uncharacterized protein n=1 Tax=Beauveria bassiana D1-5 TaxID=1245745 RepID=A0A0A2VFG0_BEABA|nr:hypothetical protein BBAD15_g9709 [Beauveria bassiana D1-5]